MGLHSFNSIKWLEMLQKKKTESSFNINAKKRIIIQTSMCFCKSFNDNQTQCQWFNLNRIEVNASSSCRLPAVVGPSLSFPLGLVNTLFIYVCTFLFTIVTLHFNTLHLKVVSRYVVIYICCDRVDSPSVHYSVSTVLCIFLMTLLVLPIEINM